MSLAVHLSKEFVNLALDVRSWRRVSDESIVPMLRPHVAFGHASDAESYPDTDQRQGSAYGALVPVKESTEQQLQSEWHAESVAQREPSNV